MYHCFHAGDILLPQKISMKKWACVACDQFSSEPEYWSRVSEFTMDAPSTFHMILPEALLRQTPQEERLKEIHATMEQYLQENLFRTYRRSFVYLERTMENGTVRRGLVGQIDLEDYDFTPGSGAKIRATEGTVLDRIPPRMKLLQGSLEFPHTIMLCDDPKDYILSAAKEARGEKVYDFELMEDGGHITGWIVGGLGVSIVNHGISCYMEDVIMRQGETPMFFAVGDGNHSLASAKACWEEIKPTLTSEQQQEHPARFALVELENIHDPAISFEPIHRVLSEVEPQALTQLLFENSAEEGHPITVITAEGEQTLFLRKQDNPLALAVLQPLLDRFLEEHGGSIDYVHGEAVVRSLSAKPDTVGIILPSMEKDTLFPAVLCGGVLPRKTFSMGHAREKRYYLEGKRRR